MAIQPQPDASALADTAPPKPPASTAGVYEYVDAATRTYLFEGAPQTAQFGDVCPLPYDPGDGRWQPSKKKVTRLPDNDPDQAAATSAAQSEARAQVHREAARQADAASGGPTDTAKGA